ncbi:MAG: zf-HC2 domain-containing protein [Eubacterium sp.]|nr:zf-HC2 domain-containing protein [Eubacterium sp.]
MRDKTCELVRELLPLYIEGDLSPASSEIVKEHLAECADCRSLYEQMEKPVGLQPQPEQVSAPINRMKKNAVLKLLKGFGILLLVIAVVIAVLAVIFSRPFFNGFEPVNQANITVEMEDGHPVLVMDEKAQEGRLTLIHRTNDDGTITMYISFGDFKSQYLFAMRTDEYYRGKWKYVIHRYFAHYHVTDDGNVFHGWGVEGGARTLENSGADDLRIFKPISVLLPEEVKEIYYVPDIDYLQEATIWANNLYRRQLTEEEMQDNTLMSTDGFDFSSLADGQLIWKADN